MTNNADRRVPPQILEGMKDQVRRTLETIERFDLDAIGSLVEKLHEAYSTGKRVFIFGNGGSAAAASHFTEDLGKGILKDISVTRRLRVQCLADSVPLITALGNDCGYDSVFREQLITNATPGDIAIAVSGSGNSPNVLRAIEWARESGLFTCGFTGFNGGKLKGLVDLCIHAGIADMEVAENCHAVAMHLVTSALRQRLQMGA